MTPVVCSVLSVEAGTPRRRIFLSVDSYAGHTKLLVEPGANGAKHFVHRILYGCNKALILHVYIW